MAMEEDKGEKSFPSTTRALYAISYLLPIFFNISAYIAKSG